MYAARQGVDTTGHNIANAHVEGYSRQRVNLVSRDPSESRGIIIGNGSYVHNIRRIHDAFLDKQVNLASQTAGNSQFKYETLKTLETLFSPEMNSNIGDEISNFFNTLEELSNNPDEYATREAVREAAKSLIKAIKITDSSLKKHISDLNEKIQNEAKDISNILKRIGTLNESIATMEVGGHSQANDLRDERDRLVKNLSEKMNINYYYDDKGMIIIRGPGQTLLVDGKNTASLDVCKNENTGDYDLIVIDQEGKLTKLITNDIENGGISGLIEVRDKIIKRIIEKNNILVENFVDVFNAIHREGYGINRYKSTNGRDFFSIEPGFGGACANIKLSDTIADSIEAIATAATPDAPGDNIVVNKLIGLKNQKIMQNGNATLLDFYANIVSQLGLEIQRAKNTYEADKIVLSDLIARKESVSGVSLDEEATNLLKWQTAFTASSKVITTIDEMFDTLLNIKR